MSKESRHRKKGGEAEVEEALPQMITDSAVEQMVAGFAEILRRQEEDRLKSMEVREQAQRRRGEERWKEEEAARQRDEAARRELEEKLEKERLELQRQMEERRMQHEKEMRELQFEHEKRKQERADKRKLADKVAKWENTDQPEAYLQRFEESMKEAGIPEEEWPQRLRPLLAGRALAAYHKDVPERAKTDYKACKEALLDALGLTVEQCRLDFWSLCKQYNESWQEAARNIEFMAARMATGCGRSV